MELSMTGNDTSMKEGNDENHSQGEQHHTNDSPTHKNDGTSQSVASLTDGASHNNSSQKKEVENESSQRNTTRVASTQLSELEPGASTAKDQRCSKFENH